MRQQDPELTEKYGPLHPEDISSYEGRSVKTGIRPIDYVWGSPEENRKKSALLKKYAETDPSLGQTIGQYTGQLWKSYAPHMGPGKDLYGMAQDKYLAEMEVWEGIAGGEGIGLRSAHQSARNPMSYIPR